MQTIISKEPNGMYCVTWKTVYGGAGYKYFLSFTKAMKAARQLHESYRMAA